MKKTWILFLIILAIACFLRFYNLGTVPVSMSDDEIRETMSSYSFIHSGKDLYGMAMPFSFNLDGFVFAPVTTYLVGIFIGIFGLTMWGARIGYAIAGIISVIGVFFLSNEILKNKYISLLSMFVVSVSVWAMQVSRFAHEGVFALMFMIYATLFLIKTKKNDYKNLIVGCILFFCAFYSYAAIKVDVLPAVLIVSVFKLKEWKMGQFITIIGFLIFLFAGFLILSKTQHAADYGANGAAQFFFLDKNKIAQEVELQRRYSYAPGLFKNIFHNKFTYITQTAVSNYLYAFSPQYLFLSQEASGIYSMWDRGQLYLIELPLLFIGLFFAFQKYRKQFYLMLSLLLIAPLPSTLGTVPTSYTMRAIYMIPFIYIFIAIGIYGFIYMSIEYRIKIFVLTILFIIYSFSVSRYFVQLNYDWKIYNASYFAKGTQDAISYIDLNKDKYTKFILVGSQKNTFLHYAFIHKLPINTIQKVMNDKETVYDNIYFIGSCLGDDNSDPGGLIDAKTLYIAPPTCHKKTVKKDVIKDMSGREVVYGIY